MPLLAATRHLKEQQRMVQQYFHYLNYYNSNITSQEDTCKIWASIKEAILRNNKAPKVTKFLTFKSTVLIRNVILLVCNHEIKYIFPLHYPINCRNQNIFHPDSTKIEIPQLNNTNKFFNRKQSFPSHEKKKKKEIKESQGSWLTWCFWSSTLKELLVPQDFYFKWWDDLGVLCLTERY